MFIFCFFSLNLINLKKKKKLNSQINTEAKKKEITPVLAPEFWLLLFLYFKSQSQMMSSTLMPFIEIHTFL